MIPLCHKLWGEYYRWQFKWSLFVLIKVSSNTETFSALIFSVPNIFLSCSRILEFLEYLAHILINPFPHVWLFSHLFPFHHRHFVGTSIWFYPRNQVINYIRDVKKCTKSTTSAWIKWKDWLIDFPKIVLPLYVSKSLFWNAVIFSMIIGKRFSFQKMRTRNFILGNLELDKQKRDLEKASFRVQLDPLRKIRTY